MDASLATPLYDYDTTFHAFPTVHNTKEKDPAEETTEFGNLLGCLETFTRLGFVYFLAFAEKERKKRLQRNPLRERNIFGVLLLTTGFLGRLHDTVTMRMNSRNITIIKML